MNEGPLAFLAILREYPLADFRGDGLRPSLFAEVRQQQLETRREREPLIDARGRGPTCAGAGSPLTKRVRWQIRDVPPVQ